MTIRELIRQLEDMDDEVKDYKLVIQVEREFGKGLNCMFFVDDITVPNDCDVDNEAFILEVK